jgi:hypothetical protein
MPPVTLETALRHNVYSRSYVASELLNRLPSDHWNGQEVVLDSVFKHATLVGCGSIQL